MTVSLFWTAVMCAVLDLLAGNIAQAQDTKHISVQGRVVDSLKTPLQGAEILVMDSTKKVIMTTRTDSNGVFGLQELEHHRPYLVLVRKIGFRGSMMGLTTPLMGDTPWINITLRQVIPQLEGVTVLARRPNTFARVFAGVKKGIKVLAEHYDPDCGKKVRNDTTPGIHWSWSLGCGPSH